MPKWKRNRNVQWREWLYFCGKKWDDGLFVGSVYALAGSSCCWVGAIEVNYYAEYTYFPYRYQAKQYVETQYEAWKKENA